MSNNNDNETGWESITIEKFKNGDRIKFMHFNIKSSEKSSLSKLVMDLLINITEKQGYTSYFDSNSVDPLASLNLFNEKDKNGQH